MRSLGTDEGHCNFFFLMSTITTVKKYAYADTNVPPSKIYVWETLPVFKKVKNKFTQKYKCRYLIFISNTNN